MCRAQALKSIKSAFQHIAVYSTIVALITAGTPASSLYADDYTWDPTQTGGVAGVGNGDWNSTSPFWFLAGSGSVAWSNLSSDNAIFNNLGGNVRIATPINVGGLVFNGTNYILTGDAANTLSLGGSSSIAVNAATTATIRATIAGTSGLNFSSTTTGSLVLAGTNTYLGTTTISSGTLNIFSDAALGNAANDITFDGASGTLQLNGPIVLGQGRQINLNNTGEVTVRPIVNGLQVVLGKITGSGTLSLVNTGMSHLLNTTNDFTGALTVNGTLVLNSIGDTAGSGNLRFGNGSTATLLQSGSGSAAPLTLNNRAIELFGTTGGFTIDSNATLAASSITVGSDLIFTGTGNKTITLTGANSGVNVFSGSINDNGASITTLRKELQSLWVLSGNNNFTGTLTLDRGTLRVTNANALGIGGTFSVGANAHTGLDIRVDGSSTINRSMSANGTTTAYIYVDHAIGSTASGGTITMGGVVHTNDTARIYVIGDHGTGLTLGLSTLNASATTTTDNDYGFNNFLSAPGFLASGYSAGVLTLNGFTTNGQANPLGTTMFLGGWGDYAIGGPITSPVAGGALALNITKNGGGLMTFAPSDMSGWTTGALSLTGGTTRVTAPLITGGATLTLGSAQLDLRNETNMALGINIGAMSGTTSVMLDHTVGGTGANHTFTFGTITTNSATMNVVGDHGYNLTTGNITINGTRTWTLNSFLAAPGWGAAGYNPGLITLGNLSTDSAAGVSTLAIGGFGDFVMSGTIAPQTAATGISISKSSLGLLTFVGDLSGWTSTTPGVLTTSAGVTRLSTATPSGNFTIGLGAGMTELRNDLDTNWSQHAIALGTASGTLVVAPAIGGNVTNKTVTLGGLTGAATTTAFSYFLDTNHQYNLTISGPSSTAATVTTTFTNVGNGLVTFAGNLTSATTSTWGFGGPGDSLVSGNISETAAAASGIAKSGFGTLTLSGTNAVNGNITLTGGILRITNPAALGGTSGTIALQGNSPAASGFDLRSDVGMDLAQHSFGTGSWNTIINVDRGLNGSGVNQTMVLAGGLWGNNNGWGLAIQGANGYSLRIGSATNTTPLSIGNNVGWTMTNFLASAAGVRFDSGITLNAVANNSIITLAGTGDYFLSGQLTASNGNAGINTLTKSGVGTLTISGNNGASFNTQTTGGASASILTMTAGIVRVANSNNLGGVNTTLNLNGATLDIRNDASQTFAQTLTIGVSNSFLNIDRAIGGSGANQTITLGAMRMGAFTGFFSSGNGYSLNTGTLTQTGAATLVNTIGGGGSLTIPTLTGTFNFALNGSGNTNITTGLTLVTGTLTKGGTGTLTISNGAGTNTLGNALALNGGALALDFSTNAAANLLPTSVAPTFAGGSLLIKGNTAAAAGIYQTLGNVTLNAGGDAKIVVDANSGAGTTLALGTMAAGATGSSLLIDVSIANSLVTTTNNATGFGTNILSPHTIIRTGAGYYFVAKPTGTAPFTLDRYTGAVALVSAPVLGTDYFTPDADMSVNATTSFNSLRIETTAPRTLTLSGAVTAAAGGVLFASGSDYVITGGSLTAGNVTTGVYDLIMSAYPTGVAKLTINSNIANNSTNAVAFTKNGPGTVLLSPTTLDGNTFTGTTFVNAGVLSIANMTRLGATVNQALTVNGGTFDLNGTSIGIGALNGSYAGAIDNLAATTATLTIGNNNTTGTFLGTIRNTTGTLSLVKVGTGAVTLGDVNGMSNLAFTGNLSITGNSTLTVAVPLTDASGSRLNLGTATAADNPTFRYTGNTNLTLTQRLFDLTGASGATIDGSGIVGKGGTAAVLTIAGDLQHTGTGNKTLTLGGSAGNVANGSTVTDITGLAQTSVINTFSGAIGNPSSGALTLAFSGAGGWAITNTNTFTGGVTLAGTGLVRATNVRAFGPATNVINVTGTSPVLDLRSDSSLSFDHPITMANSFTINVDRAIGGSGYGRIMNLGTVTETVTGKSLTVSNITGTGTQLGSGNPINGYGLRLAGLSLTNGGATTIINSLGSPGSAIFAMPTLGTGVAGAVVIDTVNLTSSVVGSHTLTIQPGSNTNGVTIIPGEITEVSGTNTLALVYTGNNYLTLAGTSATNYSGGLTISGANAVVRATTPYSLGSNAVFPVTLTNGTLELRNDASVNYGHFINWNGVNSVQLYVGEALNGTGGHNNTFSFGRLVVGTGAGRVFTVGGVGGSQNNSGDSVSFTGVTLNGLTASS